MASAARTGVLVCLGLVLAMFSLDSAITAHKMRTRGTDSQLRKSSTVTPFRSLKERDGLGHAFRARHPGDLRSTTTDTSTTRTSHNDTGDHRRAKLSAYLDRRRTQCDEANRWMSVDMARENIFNTYLFGDRFVKPENNYPSDERYVGMRRCEVRDTEADDSGWMIYRFGPFVGVGGGDWHQVWVHPLPLPSKVKFITGKLGAPVSEDGRLLGYPPIYSHHVHIEFDGVMHSLETHGDTTCSEELGGTSCYLRTYPEGYGAPFNITENFLSLNFMMNDIREYPAPPMVFYQEIALKWSSRDDVRPISIQTAHMSDGPDHPFATTLVTKRPSFLWSTTKWMVDGKVLISQKDQLPWFHSHRKFCRGAWVFTASPEELGLTMDLLHLVDDNEHKDQPTQENDLVWTPDGQDPIEALLERIEGSKAGMASLKCWLMDSEAEKVLEHVRGTNSTSSKHPEAWHQNWKDGWYDRAGEVHCDPDWSFKKGESYTVVTLNGLDARIPAEDLSIYTQHGAFFLAYESTNEEKGPVTTELYAPYHTNMEYSYSVANSWLPRYPRPLIRHDQATNPFPESDPLAREKYNRVAHLLVDELSVPDTVNVLVQRDFNRLAGRYRKKKHKIWVDARKELGKEDYDKMEFGTIAGASAGLVPL